MSRPQRSPLSHPARRFVQLVVHGITASLDEKSTYLDQYVACEDARRHDSQQTADSEHLA